MSSFTLELKDRIIRAGAGAGKTTELVKSFFDVVEYFRKTEDRFPKVVITTFTRKATQEVRERLFSEAIRRADDSLIDYLGRRSFVHVSTIHGILNVFLKENCHKVGMSADLSLIDSSDAFLQEKKLLHKILMQDPRFEELLVEYSFKNLLSYSKKYYLAWLQNPEASPVSFEELHRLRDAKLAEFKFQALSLSKTLLRETDEGNWVALANELGRFVSANTGDEILLALATFREQVPKLPSYSSKKPPFEEALKERIQTWNKAIKAFQDSYESSTEYIEKHRQVNSLFFELANQFAKELWQQKKDSSEIEMSEIELIAYRIISENPEVAEAFSKNWDYWMIDEYQDTSPVQVQLLKSLVGTKPSFVVGDPQQSIYLFRGARSEVFEQKETELVEKGITLESKMVNYRSNSDVLSYINEHFVALDPQAFSAMKVAETKFVNFQDRPAVFHYSVSSEREELQEFAVFHRVRELLMQNTRPQAIAIIARTNDTLSKIAKYLITKNVDVQVHSGGTFYHRQEIVDSILFLRFVLNPHDNLNFISFLRSGWIDIKDSVIAKIPVQSSSSFWIRAKTVLKLQVLSQLENWIAKARASGLSYAYRDFLQTSGLLNSSMKMDPSGSRQANLWKLLALISENEKSPGFNGLRFIDSEVDKAATESSGDSDAVPAIEPNRVNLMTIHASKGLQFDHVIIPDFHKAVVQTRSAAICFSEDRSQFSLSVVNDEDGSFQASLWTKAQTEAFRELEDAEVNRNLYVAMTRAKYSLTMTSLEKIGKGSWAERSVLHFDEGVTVSEGFSILRKSSEFNIEPILASELQGQEPKEKFQFQVEAEIENKSVTAEVSQNMVGNSSNAKEGLDLALLKASRGTEAHAIFESLRYQDFQTVLAQFEAAEVDSLESSRHEIIAALKFLKQTQNPSILELIENGQAEWGFSLNDGTRVLQGQVDLWSLHEGKLFVVDYKTGSEKFLEMAMQQLFIYAKAIKKVKALQISSAELLVVYPFSGKMVQRQVEI